MLLTCKQIQRYIKRNYGEMGYFLKVNEPLSVSIEHPLEKPQFSDNLSIHISLYIQEKGKAPIRPTDYVLFTNNTLVKK